MRREVEAAEAAARAEADARLSALRCELNARVAAADARDAARSADVSTRDASAGDAAVAANDGLVGAPASEASNEASTADVPTTAAAHGPPLERVTRALQREARLAADADADAGATAALEGRARRKPARYRGGRRAERGARGGIEVESTFHNSDGSESLAEDSNDGAAGDDLDASALESPRLYHSDSELDTSAIGLTGVGGGVARKAAAMWADEAEEAALRAARAHLRRQRRSVRRRQALLEEARSDWRLARRTLEVELAHTGAAGAASAQEGRRLLRAARDELERKASRLNRDATELQRNTQAVARRAAAAAAFRSARHVAGRAPHIDDFGIGMGSGAQERAC